MHDLYIYIYCLIQLHEESQEEVPYYEKLKNAVSLSLQFYNILSNCIYIYITSREWMQKHFEVAILNKSLYRKAKKPKNVQV